MNDFDKNFVLSNIDKWAKNLINSLNKVKEIDYKIIDNQKIEIIKEDLNICDGMIQFLEIQNNLPISPIKIKNNYLSKLCFYQRYINKKGNFIFGITNKISSKKILEILSELYGLEFDYILLNNIYLYKELTSNISINYNIWITNIIRIVNREIKGGRGILILCEDLNHCKDIYEKINNNLNDLKLIKIINEDNEDKLINLKLGPKSVIISSEINYNKINLELEESLIKSGGTHIIITYIPKDNKITEKKYIKNGNFYTWQFVINFEETIKKYYIYYDTENEYLKYQNLLKKSYTKINEVEFFTMKNIFKLREEKDIKKSNNLMKYINNIINKQDFLFNSYCKMIKEKKELENEIYLKSVEEKYILFLHNLDIYNKNINEIKQKFEEFKNEINTEIDKGTIVLNTSFYSQYLNKQLSLLFENEDSKLISEEIKKIRGDDIFQTAKDIFIKKEEIKVNYDEYIEKSNESIALYSYSFVPYYLKGICKIKKEKDFIDTEDFKKSLFYINEEIKRNFYLFGLFFSMNINIETIFYKINLLISIKNHILEDIIKCCVNNNLDRNGIKFYKKRSVNFFYSYERNKNKVLNNNFNEYSSYIKYNGLKNFFTLNKICLWDANSLILTGIIMIGLSVSDINSLKDIINEGIFSNIRNLINSDISLSEFDEWIKTKHENMFKFSWDNKLNDFIKNKNINLDNIENELQNVIIKFDNNDYKQKLENENKKMIKTIFIKKINKLNLYKFKNYLKDNNNDYNLIHTNNNIKLEKKIKEIQINLNEKKRKLILANNFIRIDGKDFITNDRNETEDIYDIIENSSNDLYYIADKVIIDELKRQLRAEIDSKNVLWKIKREEAIKNNNEKNIEGISNNLSKIINERTEIYDNLENNIKIDFATNELKINFNKIDKKITEVNIIIKQIEKDANIAYNDELKRIALYEIKKEKNKEVIKKRNEFEQSLLNILKENNINWENCFNKNNSLQYIYDQNDIKKIIKYNIRKNEKIEEFYYLSDINNDKKINKAIEKLKNKKIIIGNYFNEINIWCSYCLFHHNNTIIFLYKSMEGKIPSINLTSIIKKIYKGKYITKINKISENNDMKYSEVYAIENTKIIIEQLTKNKNDFITDFEKYKFFKENKRIEELKQKKYPEEFILEIYEEMKKRNNSQRISLILFRYFFMKKDVDYKIDIEYLTKIYEILLNYNKINIKEKKIIKNEYSEILNIYNKYYENNDQNIGNENNKNTLTNKIKLIKKKNNSRNNLLINSNINSQLNELKLKKNNNKNENNIKLNKTYLEKTSVKDIISDNKNIEEEIKSNNQLKINNDNPDKQLLDSNRRNILDSQNVIITEINNENDNNDFVYSKVQTNDEANLEKENNTLKQSNKVEIYNQNIKKKNCWEKLCSCFKHN